MSQPDGMIEEKPIGRAGYSSEATDEAMRVWTGVPRRLARQARRTLVEGRLREGVDPGPGSRNRIAGVRTLRIGWEITFWPLVLP